MEQIIGKLSEIETTAEIIMKDALQKKKALSAEMERQSKEFDTQLEKQTEEQIKEIRRNLEGEKDKRLSSLREDTQAALSQLDAYYAKNHERLSREIFEKIIQEEVIVMGSVLSYSGIYREKYAAMSSHLVTDEQLQEIVRFSDVPQVAAYLKKTPEYAKAWSDLDENNLHRGEIEKLLKKSIFGNFSRIYNFANKEQRKFLALYSKRYEIRVLKEIMTNLFDHRSTDPVDMSPYRDFFLHHSKLDIDRVAGAGNMDEFMTALKGNEFYAPLQSVYENGNGLLFDYGMALDLYYFNQIWSVRKKLFKGNNLDEITKALW